METDPITRESGMAMMPSESRDRLASSGTLLSRTGRYGSSWACSAAV